LTVLFEKLATLAATWVGGKYGLLTGIVIIFAMDTSLIDAVSFAMLFLAANNSNREMKAIQRKLDVLVASIDEADNEFIGLDHLSEKEIDAHDLNR